jgi:hypothetical protein
VRVQVKVQVQGREGAKESQRSGRKRERARESPSRSLRRIPGLCVRHYNGLAGVIALGRPTLVQSMSWLVSRLVTPSTRGLLVHHQRRFRNVIRQILPRLPILFKNGWSISMRVEHLDVTYLTMIYYSGIWIFQGRMDHQVHTYSDTYNTEKTT